MKCSDKEWQHCNKEKYGCEGCFYNDEISIGEYVRTPKQGICIISHINKPFKDDDKNKVCLCQNSKVAFVSINSIKQLKHSKDIIDLIEVGDYVNGNKVIDIAQAPVKAAYTEDREQRLALIPIVNEQIEIVVTKEQIKQIEFRIKE